MLALHVRRSFFCIPVVFPRLSNNVNDPRMVDADAEETPILPMPSLTSFIDGVTEEEVFPLPVVLVDAKESCRDCELIELLESPELML